MKRRIVCLLLAAVLLCSIFAGFVPKARALHTWITDRSKLKGADYTKSDVMAQKLESIFDGNISVYYNSGCTNPVSAPIGSYVMKVGSGMYAGPYGGPSINYGSSCWIYAQGVYYTLFEDYVLNNKGQTGNSENIDMTTTATTNCTYENFKAWGVRQGVGAMLRAAGHSMIVLGYDETKLITLEGNVDNGLVCVRERSWDQVKNKYSSFTFIVQPTEEYMQDHYGYCRHEQMSGLGTCPDCGYGYNWQRTFQSTAAGYYTVNTTCVSKADAPYSAAESGTVLATGETVAVQGSVVNYFEELWYQVLLDDGTVVYAPGSVLDFSDYLTLEVTCSRFTPADGLALKAASYPLSGIVNSNYPLKKIDAYLNGTWYAAWSASNKATTQVSLNPTDINMDLSFSKLEPGKYVITLVATDYVHSNSVTFHRSAFYIVGDDECLHSYTSEVTTEATCSSAGETTYTCSLCGNSYTEQIAALGHSYSNGYCIRCGSLDFGYVFTTAQIQVETVEGAAGQTVSVPVRISQNQCFAKFTFTVSYDTQAMTLSGVTAGTMMKNGTLSRSGSTVTWSGTKNIVGDGTLFYLNFDLSDTAAAGEYAVSISLKSNSTYYFRDENNYARDVKMTAGAVRCSAILPVSVYENGVEQGSYSSLQQAVDNYSSDSQYLKLNRDLSESAVLSRDLYIDLNGFDLSGTLNTQNGKVYGMDSTTDGYTCTSIGYFSCIDQNGSPVIPQTLTQKEQKQYILLETGEGFSFHRIYAGITHTTIKPAAEGVGYKAVFAADDMVKAQLDSYGFTLQLAGNEPVFAEKTAADFVSLDTVTMRVDGYDAKRWGEKQLTAQVYMVINGKTVTSAARSYSLRQIMEQVNQNAAVLSDEQKALLARWIGKTPAMQSWNVENICN